MTMIDDGSQGQGGIPPNARRQLEEATETARKEAADAKAQLAALQRERAFDQLAVPTEGPGKLFRKAYDGPVDDPAVVKAALTEYGIVTVTDQGAQGRIDRSLAGSQQAQAAAAGGQPPSTDDELMAELARIRQEYDYPGGLKKGIAATAALMHQKGFVVEEQVRHVR